MNKKYYPGRHLHSENKVVKKIVDFLKIKTMFETGELIKPTYQGALEEKRVESMISSYLKNPEYFQYKNTIVVGDVNGKLYIIDGQHRVMMAVSLCKRHQKYRKKMIVAYYKLKNQKEALKLFNEINIDSKKNQNYINLNSFDQIIINEFREMLKEYYGDCFSKKKTKIGKLKCIEEFVDELYSIQFFKNNKDTNKAFSELKKLNDEFFKKLYESHYNDNSYSNLFYKKEEEIIAKKVVFTTKQNNFIKYIQHSNTPFHRWKKNKKRITQGKKKKTWFKEFGEKKVAICPISFCNTQIAYDKYQEGIEVFEAGHIISEYNGGEGEVSNLRPICKSCNCSMSSNNWNDYDNLEVLMNNLTN